MLSDQREEQEPRTALSSLSGTTESQRLGKTCRTESNLWLNPPVPTEPSVQCHLYLFAEHSRGVTPHCPMPGLNPIFRGNFS